MVLVVGVDLVECDCVCFCVLVVVFDICVQVVFQVVVQLCSGGFDIELGYGVGVGWYCLGGSFFRYVCFLCVMVVGELGV